MQDAVYVAAAPTVVPSAAGTSTMRSALPMMLLVTWALVEFVSLARSVADNTPGAWSQAATAVVVLVAATVSSVVGFAFAALAGIGLAFIATDPVHAVHTIVLCSIATQVYAVWQLRKSVQWRALLPMLAGGVLTVPCGVWLLLHAQATMYRLGLGAFLIAYGAFSICRSEDWVVKTTRWRDFVAGVMGGFVGGLTAFPGALLTIWCSLRGLDKMSQRAIYQPYILLMQLSTVASLQILGRGQLGDTHDLHYVVFAVIGAAAGFAYFKRLSVAQFRVALNGLLIVSGAGLLFVALGAPAIVSHVLR